jgi:hypothetical protein
VLAAALLLSACGSSAKPKKAIPKAVPTPFDSANFGAPAKVGRNPYFPLTPGRQGVRKGTTEVGGRAVPHEVTTTVTDVHRMIAGVKTTVMLDHEVDGGQVTSISLDYVAEDKRGNLWNLGGYTEEYEGGRLVSAIDPWMQGVNGAKAGILVQAAPKLSTPFYPVSHPDGQEGDVAEVVKRGIRWCVPYDCFKDVLVVREGKASAPDNEFKYYARNVGQVDNVPRGASRHKDVERLVNLLTLSPQALTEIDKEALRLDHNAPKLAPRQFAGRPVARRG